VGSWLFLSKKFIILEQRFQLFKLLLLEVITWLKEYWQIYLTAFFWAYWGVHKLWSLIFRFLVFTNIEWIPSFKFLYVLFRTLALLVDFFAFEKEFFDKVLIFSLMSIKHILYLLKVLILLHFVKLLKLFLKIIWNEAV